MEETTRSFNVNGERKDSTIDAKTFRFQMPPPTPSSDTRALIFNLADTQIQRTAPKPKRYQSCSAIMSVHEFHDPIRASIERALVLAPSSFFDGSLFAKTMKDIVQPHHSDEATSTASYTKLSDDLNTAQPAPTHQQVDFGKVHHRISATETPFGTVWLRTSTVRAGSCSKSLKGVYAVNSFVYYPSWWLTKLGLTHGVEASLSSSTKGWQFCLNPVRAVPDSSLIFDFCKMGNIDGVQRLLARGDATVRDASPKGWTPLHVSREFLGFPIWVNLGLSGLEKLLFCSAHTMIRHTWNIC